MPEPNGYANMDLASIGFGFFMGIVPFTFFTIISQTERIARSSNVFRSAYVYMIWLDVLINFVFAIMTYLYLIDVIEGSLSFYSATVAMWTVHTQMLPQIMANRISLVMFDKRKATWLKIALFTSILGVNLTVCSLWVPAQRSTAQPDQIRLNHIFETVEKTFFLVLDLALNIFFLFLVHHHLIAGGLNKYWRLFKWNIGMVCLSTAMDALVLGLLRAQHSYLYVQFDPVAYIIKLHIELAMASLIAKIASSGSIRGHMDNTMISQAIANSRSRLRWKSSGPTEVTVSDVSAETTLK